MKVTPLLTPDKLPGGQQGQYVTHIINLIKGAQNAIYIELQYIEASKADGSPYDELLQTIKNQIAAKKDVKLIVSANYAEKWGEKMKDEGVDLTANIYTLPNVHNKGFVIDGKTVVISSQNFSPSDVCENRDAGLILESEDIAQYFAPIFDADWRDSRPARGARSLWQGRSEEEKKAGRKETKEGAPAAGKLNRSTKGNADG